MPRYEYQILELSDDEDLDHLQRVLNSFGDEGWELIGLNDDLMIFKRRKLGLD